MWKTQKIQFEFCFHFINLHFEFLWFLKLLMQFSDQGEDSFEIWSQSVQLYFKRMITNKQTSYTFDNYLCKNVMHVMNFHFHFSCFMKIFSKLEWIKEMYREKIEECYKQNESSDSIIILHHFRQEARWWLLKKPLHFREIQWGIYNTTSLKCNGFFIKVLEFSLAFYH